MASLYSDHPETRESCRKRTLKMLEITALQVFKHIPAWHTHLALRTCLWLPVSGIPSRSRLFSHRSTPWGAGSPPGCPNSEPSGRRSVPTQISHMIATWSLFSQRISQSVWLCISSFRQFGQMQCHLLATANPKIHFVRWWIDQFSPCLLQHCTDDHTHPPCVHSPWAWQGVCLWAPSCLRPGWGRWRGAGRHDEPESLQQWPAQLLQQQGERSKKSSWICPRILSLQWNPRMWTLWSVQLE